jgi:hypothetical protein
MWLMYQNLAALLEDRGRYSEAAALYRRAFAILQVNFGSDSPRTLQARKNYDDVMQLIRRNSGTSGR